MKELFVITEQNLNPTRTGFLIDQIFVDDERVYITVAGWHTDGGDRALFVLPKTKPKKDGRWVFPKADSGRGYDYMVRDSDYEGVFSRPDREDNWQAFVRAGIVPPGKPMPDKDTL